MESPQITTANKSFAVGNNKNARKVVISTDEIDSIAKLQKLATTNLNSKKRSICLKCKFPTPKACICHSLPVQPLNLIKCRIIVLQHPHELRRKNRSLPLLQLCVSENNIFTATSKCLDEHVDENVMNMLLHSNNLMLVFPSDDSIDLKEGIETIKNRIKSNPSKITSEIVTQQQHNDEIITILFIDATWKYAKEMYKKTTLCDAWPKNMLEVKLSPSYFHNNNNNKWYYKPNRFNIRSTPSFDQMSTAECIAFVVSIVEGRDDLYEILMKPLDCMVNIWNTFKKDRKEN